MRLQVEKLADGGYIVLAPGSGPVAGGPMFASSDLSGVLNYLVEKFEPKAVTVDTYPGGIAWVRPGEPA